MIFKAAKATKATKRPELMMLYRCASTASNIILKYYILNESKKDIQRIESIQKFHASFNGRTKLCLCLFNVVIHPNL